MSSFKLPGHPLLASTLENVASLTNAGIRRGLAQNNLECVDLSPLSPLTVALLLSYTATRPKRRQVGASKVGLRSSLGARIFSPPDIQMVFPQQGVTELLVASSEGDKAALDKLMPVVYDELRRLAQNYLSRERAGHTLQTTALVHEAYLRLIDQKSVNWQNRAQFFGIAAQMMRRILINHARDRQAKKRQGYATKVSLDDAVNLFEKRELDLMALNEALEELAVLDPQQTQIVELRFFGGLTIEEIAEVLDISTATTKRDWDSAKLWLRRQLSNRR
jgi:RNA polymerase sigma factor (TIGR02999 family)